MQRLSLLLVLVIVTKATPAHAQRFGDGTFLRRMLGVERPAAVQEYEKQRLEAQRGEALQKQATPYEGETPAQRASQWPPSTASQREEPRGYRPPANMERRATLYRSPNSQQRPPEPTLATRSNPSHHGTREQPRVERSGEKDGFGITLKENGNNVVIARIIKSGTGAKAGLQQGDIVKSIGSLPIATLDDVKQFSEVLKPGDQIEFEVIRRGKEEQVMVPFLREWSTEAEEQHASDDDDKKPWPASARLFSQKSDQERPSVASLSETRLPIRAAADPAKVDELRVVIQRQAQLIEKLQNRLQNLEQAQALYGPAL